MCVWVLSECVVILLCCLIIFSALFWIHVWVRSLLPHSSSSSCLLGTLTHFRILVDFPPLDAGSLSYPYCLAFVRTEYNATIFHYYLAVVNSDIAPITRKQTISLISLAFVLKCNRFVYVLLHVLCMRDFYSSLPLAFPGRCTNVKCQDSSFHTESLTVPSEQSRHNNIP